MMTVDEAMSFARNELECAFEKWLSDEGPSGDCESVERQWEESFAHQELVDELQPVMALTWEVRCLRDDVNGLTGTADRLEKENAALRTDAAAMNKSMEMMREENERLKDLMAKRSREHQQEMTSYRLRVKSQDNATFAALLEENERLRKDAERYQWLRELVSSKDGTIQAQGLFWNCSHSRRKLDAALDAARSAKALPEPAP